MEVELLNLAKRNRCLRHSAIGKKSDSSQINQRVLRRNDDLVTEILRSLWSLRRRCGVVRTISSCYHAQPSHRLKCNNNCRWQGLPRRHAEREEIEEMFDFFPRQANRNASKCPCGEVKRCKIIQKSFRSQYCSVRQGLSSLYARLG